MIDISYIKTQDNADQACCTVNSGCRGLGFIGVAVGLIIGILIYSEVNAAIDCPTVAEDADGNAACERAKSIAWTVISILPISMFFALFAIYLQQLSLCRVDSVDSAKQSLNRTSLVNLDSSHYQLILGGVDSVDSAEQSLNHDIAYDNFSHVKKCNLNQSESVLNACDRAETFRGKVVV
jgi:hypothetical protein